MSPTPIAQAIQTALQHHQAGQLQQAEALYRQVLAQDPNQPDALHFLGMLAHQVGRNDTALDLMQRAIVVNPNVPLYHSNLSHVFRALARPADAADACRRAIALRPDFAEAHTNLGIALQEQGRSVEAVESYYRSLSLRPDFAATYNNLGVALQTLDRLPEAVAAYDKAIALAPTYADAWNNLGSLRMGQGKMEEAIACCRKAVELRPESSALHNGLLFALEFDPNATTATIRAEQDAWAQRHAEPLYPKVPPQINDRSPDRRLRVGYVSPNLRGHIIGRLLETFLVHHDRQQFFIACYSDTLAPDAITHSLKQHSDLWRDTAGLTDEQLAQQVREDQIDILVDLNLHMAQNRLLVFARKPVPVQVTYLGYPASTGLRSMDYRLTDRYLNPDVGSALRTSEPCRVGLGPPSSNSREAALLSAQPAADGTESIARPTDAPLVGQAPPYAEGPEKLVYLPHGYWCYKPPAEGLEVTDLPALSKGHLTFGCFNNFAKVNSRVIELWSKLLNLLPQSQLRLLICGGQRNSHVYERFESCGIERQRIRLLDRQPTAEYLKLYQAVDVALDPFPYNGHTTSYDALYMGVPVVSLAGERAVSRAGLSILSHLGLEELVAQSPEQYVQIAVGLASDLPRLAQLRQSLRPRLERSPLMDAAGFARDIEQAYRQMWRATLSGLRDKPHAHPPV